jgi:arginyl-tRNA synthetase
MIQAREELLEAMGAAIAEVSPAAALAPAFEAPKQAALGDLASTAALQLA